MMSGEAISKRVEQTRGSGAAGRRSLPTFPAALGALGDLVAVGAAGAALPPRAAVVVAPRARVDERRLPVTQLLHQVCNTIRNCCIPSTRPGW